MFNDLTDFLILETYRLSLTDFSLIKVLVFWIVIKFL